MQNLKIPDFIEDSRQSRNKMGNDNVKSKIFNLQFSIFNQ